MDVLKECGSCHILESEELNIAEKILELIKNELPKEARSYLVVKEIITTTATLLDEKPINL